MIEELDEAECRRLIEPGGVGRLAFEGRYDLTVLPVNYKMHNGAIVFRTAAHSSTDEDLRTGIGIANAEYKVAFEVDSFSKESEEGWSVLVQGPAHHVDEEDERADVEQTGVQPWAGQERQHYIRITPSRITGRRVQRDSDA